MKVSRWKHFLMEGIAPARISRGGFDLVVCDMKMPNLAGQTLYESLTRRRGAPCRTSFSL